MPKITDIQVYGLGAAGSNTLINLLYAFPTLNYTGVDFDIVEDRNIEPGTQPYTKADLRRQKTQAIQRLAMLAKNKRIETINKKILSVKDITDMVKGPQSTLIIDAFDNAESRNLFTKLPKKYNVVHIGFSATLSGEVVWDGVFTPMEKSEGDKQIDVCEMAIARSFIFALTSIATITIGDFLENGKKNNVYFDKNLNLKRF